MYWEIWDTQVWAWVLSLGVLALATSATHVIRRRARGHELASAKSHGTWSELIRRLISRWSYWTTVVVGLSVIVQFLQPPGRIVTIARAGMVIALGVQAIRFVGPFIDWIIQRIGMRSRRPGANGDLDVGVVASFAGVTWAIRFATIALISLLVLQNLGVDVTALVAGLGIGGIAIALALQSVLSDLFASLTIALDRPFVIGDFIVVGSEMGTVEHVGLKTTRVRSLSGEQLVFSNSDLLGSRIRNFKRMTERRVLFGFGVVYLTPLEVLEEITAIVRQAVESQSSVRFDRCHFFRFGSSSLDFEAVYYINSADYNAHMDTQQAVHLAIARAFRDRDIEFAFPTQTLFLEASLSGRSTEKKVHNWAKAEHQD